MGKEMLKADNDDRRTWSALQDQLRALALNGRLALAFSGGLDSRFLAHSAWTAGLSPLLLHAAGPHISARERDQAQAWAAGRALEFHSFEINPLTLEQVAVNDPQRCYYCKTALFTCLQKAAGDLTLCDGTHASDSQGYRPGLAALKELGIRSPLAEAGLDKPAIRHLAAYCGLDYPQQKPRPCLLTRLDYGQRPDAELLAALDRGEQGVETILGAWTADRGAENDAMPDFRLRQVREGVFDLHLTPLPPLLIPGKDPPRPLFRALEQAVRDSAGLTLSGVVVMAACSGYFDQKRLVSCQHPF